MTLNFIQLPGEPKPTTPPWSLVRTPQNFRVLKSQVTQTQYVGLKPVEDLRCQVPKSLRTIIFCKSSRVPDDFDINHDFQNCFQNLPGLYFSTCGLRTRVSSSVSLWQRGAGVSLFGLFALSLSKTPAPCETSDERGLLSFVLSVFQVLGQFGMFLQILITSCTCWRRQRSPACRTQRPPALRT